MVFCISVFRRSTKSQFWLLRRVNVKGSGICILYEQQRLRDRLHNMSVPCADNATASKGDLAPMDPRGYQLEMLAESMSKNIIIAVGNLYPLPYFQSQTLHTADGHRKRQNTYVREPDDRSGVPSLWVAKTEVDRALLRIGAELDRCSPEKVPFHMDVTLFLTEIHAARLVSMSYCSPCTTAV